LVQDIHQDVHFPGAHMQWQRDLIGQIAGIGPRAAPERSATAHNAAGLDAEPDMAGQMHLDILSGIGGAQQAGRQFTMPSARE